MTARDPRCEHGIRAPRVCAVCDPFVASTTPSWNVVTPLASGPEPPATLAQRPRDAHGRIIPWTSGYNEAGEAMLGTNSAGMAAKAILERRCGLCGEPIGYWVAFMGDEECVAKREFLEPPMHLDCARYAAKVCPYLNVEGYESRRQRPGVMVVADRSSVRRMAIYVTRSYKPKTGNLPMSKAAPAKRIDWLP